VSASADPFWRRFRSALVIVEIAIALVLLAGASAIVSTVRQLMAVDLGARGERALAVELTLPRASYEPAAQRRRSTSVSRRLFVRCLRSNTSGSAQPSWDRERWESA
jgi:hypothetical protein